MNFNKDIQEDAWLNYAKLSYDIGNPYESVPQVLSRYIEQYPDADAVSNVEYLLLDAYISSKNYANALKLLEKKRDYESRIAYQKVTFLRALELYREEKYLESQALLKESLKESKDAVYTARATFWNAEVNYILTDYEEALLGFKTFEQEADSNNVFAELENIDYSLGYTYFKLKRYPKAIYHFENFIAKNKDNLIRLNDAHMRLGDCHFTSSNYENAIEAYDNAIRIDEIHSDYSEFQKSLSMGYLKGNSEKIKLLETFISKYPKSKLCDDALFELGNTYSKTNASENAIKKYQNLYKNYPSSPLVSKAKLRQGLIEYNKDSNDEALKILKDVATNYPGTPEAVESLSTIRLIYIDLGLVGDYAKWIKTLNYVDVSDTELDNTSYEAAEKQYLDNNTDKAIKQFNLYLNDFPNGIHALPAHFYVAQLYYKKGLTENASEHYKWIIDAPQNEFSEQALVRFSQYLLEDKQWNNAIPQLERLRKEANYPQNIIFSESNLMKAHYQSGQYEKAVFYADHVLEDENIDNKIKSDAYTIIARSAIKTGDDEKAKTAYAKIESIATGETAAEALYYNAYFKHKAGDYNMSNNVMQKLVKTYAQYKYYSAKGLIVMAKNFYALEDTFQATYILESVIENFDTFPKIKDEASKELERIKQEASKTNSSVTTEDK